MSSQNNFLYFNSNDINIFYRKNENGGGMDFGQDYINIIKNKYGPQEKLFEFCSGPGFIGFSLLGAGLIKEKLILSDVHTPLKDSINKTLDNNNLRNIECLFYNVGKVKDITETDIDFIVSNPPHFNEDPHWLNKIEDRIYKDYDWQIHKEFYGSIRDKLSNSGTILIQENKLGSEVKDFESMIKKSGLKITSYFDKEKNTGKDQIYYIEVRKDNWNEKSLF